MSMTDSADEARAGENAPSSEAAPQPARGGWHFGEWLSELIGTTLLVFGALSAVILAFYEESPVAQSITSEPMRLLFVGVAIGLTIVLIVISPIGRLSGAHINPVVTLAFKITGHVHPHDLGGYWAAQFAGGVLGAALLGLAWGPAAASVHYGAIEPSVGALQGIGIEALMTGALVLALFVFLSSPRTTAWTPVAAAVVVVVATVLGGAATGTGLNPARTLGPNVVAGDFTSWWVYFVGPAAGAAVVAVLWRLVPRTILTAKLFHDPRYPSVLRTHLPARPPKA